MSPQLMKALIEKKLFVKKTKKVQGSICIHFPSPDVQDLVLSGWDPVDVFGRINMTAEQVRLSNLEAHIINGDIEVVK